MIWVHMDHQTACPHKIGKGRGRNSGKFFCTAGRQVQEIAAKKCEGCDKTVKSHGWAISNAGWLALRDGTVYCPDHKPDWYADWASERLMRKLETQLLIRIWDETYEGG